LAGLARFQAKRRPVRVKRTRQIKNLEPRFALVSLIIAMAGAGAFTFEHFAATFQALPGASFVVNGAAQASDSALVTVSAEKKWLNGWSAAATFEGEFSNVTASYAGKGVVRYSW
jgi:hypothetical protein